MEYYSAVKKNCDLSIFNEMGGDRDFNAEQNKSVRERQISYDFTLTWNLRNKISKGKRERERETNEETDSSLQRTNRWLPEGRG